MSIELAEAPVTAPAAPVPQLRAHQAAQQTTQAAALTAMPTLTPPAASGEPAGVLAFTVGDEAYAVDILQVREIRSIEPVLRIAGAPADMLGVIHLRGKIVPLVCLRRRLGLETGGAAATGGGAVIVVDDGLGGHVGAVVDGVTSVVDLLPSQRRALPALPADSNGLSRHLLGMAHTDETLLLLVDLRGLLRAMPGAAALAPAVAPHP